MQLVPDTSPNNVAITRYTPQEIVIADTSYSTSLIITTREVITPWLADEQLTLQLDDIVKLANLQPQVVIIGTGTRLTFPQTAVLAPLINANIGYEIMSTQSACYTFNALLSEGRDVVAGMVVG